jgi:hypothetical protein
VKILIGSSMPKHRTGRQGLDGPARGKAPRLTGQPLASAESQACDTASACNCGSELIDASVKRHSRSFFWENSRVWSA